MGEQAVTDMVPHRTLLIVFVTLSSAATATTFSEDQNAEAVVPETSFDKIDALELKQAQFGSSIANPFVDGGEVAALPFEAVAAFRTANNPSRLVEKQFGPVGSAITTESDGFGSAVTTDTDITTGGFDQALGSANVAIVQNSDAAGSAIAVDTTDATDDDTADAFADSGSAARQKQTGSSVGSAFEAVGNPITDAVETASVADADFNAVGSAA